MSDIYRTFLYERKILPKSFCLSIVYPLFMSVAMCLECRILKSYWLKLAIMANVICSDCYIYMTSKRLRCLIIKRANNAVLLKFTPWIGKYRANVKRMRWEISWFVNMRETARHDIICSPTVIRSTSTDIRISDTIYLRMLSVSDHVTNFPSEAPLIQWRTSMYRWIMHGDVVCSIIVSDGAAVMQGSLLHQKRIAL